MGRPAWGDGLGTRNGAGAWLDCFFEVPRVGLPDAEPKDGEQEAVVIDDLRRVHVERVRLVIDLDEPPSSVPDGYLRLHLLSHRAVAPNSLNLDGLFSVLPIVCWTSIGPIDPADLSVVRTSAITAGRHLEVRVVDRIPRMVDYVLPSGVRIADGDRVRLGAHLAEGTTVMHEGLVNYNAGTLGPSMVEGRISQGVVVDEGSDIGGGASTMGTLSGGGRERVSIGKRCLLGANSGLGIALGDDCIVEAGLYLTAGTVVTTPDGSAVKARELSGHSGVLFRRNSQSGKVEAVQRVGTWGELNASLHANR